MHRAVVFRILYDAVFVLAASSLWLVPARLSVPLYLKWAVLVFSVCVWYAFRFMVTFAAMGLPHPVPLPFVGNLLEWAMKNYLVALDSWQKRFGRVYGFYLGRSPVICIADAELFEQLIVKNQAVLYNRPQVFALQEHRRNVFEVLDEDHKRQRKILLPAFSSLSLRAMWPLMNDACGILLSKLAAVKPGEPVDVHAAIQQMTMDVIGTTSLGQRFHAQTDPDSTIVRMTNVVFQQGLATISPFALLAVMFPLLQPLFVFLDQWLLSFGRRVRAARVFLDDQARRMVRQREALLKGAEHTPVPSAPADTAVRNTDYADLLDLMLRARDSASGARLTEREVLDNSSLFVLAGYETTANTLTFTLYLLAKHPEWQERLATELEAAVRALGQQTISPDVMNSVPPLVDAVLNESLRLYPVAALNMRQLGADCDIGPYRAPKGALVLGCMATMHRDPAYWDEPDRFNPSRFLDAGVRHARPAYAFAPFGGGSRSCIGMRFAQVEARLSLMKLVYHFRFDLTGSSKQEPLPLNVGITLSPRGGLPMTVQLRHPLPAATAASA